MRIVSWNVNGLYATLKDAANRYSSASKYFSEVLQADIVCFQEAKIQEEKLEKWMACVPGFDSYWAFSQEKKGYSGVVTYVKEEFLPLDARADCLSTSNDLPPEDLCREGRLMYTDHGSFVLLNVYVPNGGDQNEGRPRLEFKLRYLEALQQKCDELVRSGRHVVIVGDFNVAHRDIDVHRRWKVGEIYAQEETDWIDRFLTKYVDVFRHFHPNASDVFSVWNQKTESRIHNEGLRIDYAVCDKAYLSEVTGVEIVKMVPKKWSDHAAVVLTLQKQPTMLPHLAPALSSRNMKRFHDDPRQKKLTALFCRGTTNQDLASKAGHALADSEDLPTLVPSSSGSPVLSCSQVEEEREGKHLSEDVGSTPASSQMQMASDNDLVSSPKLDIADAEPRPSGLKYENSSGGSSVALANGKRPSKMGVLDSSPVSKKLMSKSKEKGKSASSKRKAEGGIPVAKGGGGKQRSLVSFFKAPPSD